jgi:hypothetical protein
MENPSTKPPTPPSSPPLSSSTDSTQDTVPALPQSPVSHGPSIIRIAIIASIVFVIMTLIPFAVGVGLALSDIDRAGEFIRLIRDVFIIVLSMGSILIVIALTVLIIQIASLVNLLQTEIKPLLENLQKTMTTVSGTAKFVGANVAQPLIKAGGFMAGVAVFARELGGIRKALSRSDQNGTASTAVKEQKHE